MATISRIDCPRCKASCIDGETSCWQCGTLLKPPPTSTRPAPAAETARLSEPPKRSFTIRFPRTVKPAETKPEPEAPKELIHYDPEHLATAMQALPMPEVEEHAENEPLLPPEPEKRYRTTLTGEVIEEDVPASTVPLPASAAPVAATIGASKIDEVETEEVMTLTFCRNCGFENEPGKKECAKCGKQLETIAVKDYKEMEALPRAWGFDILGGVWVILGIAAIWAGQFLLQTNQRVDKPSIADYLWTGVVAIAPGVLVFMRHHFARMLFWVMTLGSIMVWSVLFVVWITGHLHVSDKGQVGLTWLLSLSILSAISFFLVRTNDAFDYEIGAWLGRE